MFRGLVLTLGGIVGMAVLAIPLSVLATTGSILQGHTFAWSDEIGYVNFENVEVSDATLDGYAWSASKGWINFQPSAGGVTNNDEGALSGYAWGEQIGWIDFSGVEIDANGQFSGTATGDLIGTLTFDCAFCDVQTDWSMFSSPSGGGGGRSTAATTQDDTTEEVLPEGTTQLSQRARVSDIVLDGVVDILDFNALMVAWGRQEQNAAADVTGDGVTDVFDFNLLMVMWGVTYNV